MQRVHGLSSPVGVRKDCRQKSHDMTADGILLTTSQMGALAGKACSTCLLPARSQGILCIGGGFLAVAALLRGRAVVGLLFGSHVVVQVTPVLGRGRCILGVWGGHDIPLLVAARTDAAVLGAVGAGDAGLAWVQLPVPSPTVQRARLEAIQRRVLESITRALAARRLLPYTLTALGRRPKVEPVGGRPSIRRAGIE